MATLFQRGGVWWVTYYQDGRRARESLKTTNKSIAERKRAKLEAEARQEAVAEVVAAAFVMFVQLAERGREKLAYPTVLAVPFLSAI